jgi:hypothetical protein
MPAKQRRRAHEEGAPARAGQQSTRRRQEDPVARPQLPPTCLPAQHRQLMPQDHDLQLLKTLRARPQQHKLQQAAQRQIAKRPEQEQLLGDQRDGTPTLRGLRSTDLQAELTHPSRVSVDPRLGELPRSELLELIESQANAIRILQHKLRRFHDDADERT